MALLYAEYVSSIQHVRSLDFSFFPVTSTIHAIEVINAACPLCCHSQCMSLVSFYVLINRFEIQPEHAKHSNELSVLHGDEIYLSDNTSVVEIFNPDSGKCKSLPKKVHLYPRVVGSILNLDIEIFKINNQ